MMVFSLFLCSAKSVQLYWFERLINILFLFFWKLKHFKEPASGAGGQWRQPRGTARGRGDCLNALPLPWGDFIWRMNEKPTVPVRQVPHHEHIFLQSDRKPVSSFLTSRGPSQEFPACPGSSSEGVEAQWRPYVANGSPLVSGHMPPG